MAKNNKFLLVSLSDNEAKKLAQIVSNDTCRKILDYLTEKTHATESQIAKELTLPISTVHYNLQQLQKGRLVSVEEFHYSEKGKEVNHYKLANKYIIIAPKSTYGIKEKLKTILPVAGLTAGLAFAMQLIRGKTFAAKPFGVPEAAELVEDLAFAPAAAEPNVYIWFFAGAAVALVLVFLIDWIRNR